MSMTATEARREYQQAWREKNRDKIRAYNREWRKENQEKIKAANNRYWEKKAAEANQAKEEATA